MNTSEIVRRVQLTTVKARSIAAENEHLDLMVELQPEVYSTGGMSLMTMTEAMLKDGRIPQSIDVFNLLTIANMALGFNVIYFSRWEEELPEATDAFSMEIA